MSETTIGLELDRTHDVYIAYPCCHLATEADCLSWFEAYLRVFEPLHRRVDIVFVLDMFSVEPAIAEVWGRYRAELHERFIRHTVRVSSQGLAAVVFESRSQRHVAQTKSADIESAIAAILKLRASGGAAT